MENPIKMDDLGGKPTIFGNTRISLWQISKKSRIRWIHQLPPGRKSLPTASLVRLVNRSSLVTGHEADASRNPVRKPTRKSNKPSFAT